VDRRRGLPIGGGHAIPGGGYDTAAGIKFITRGQHAEFAGSSRNGAVNGTPLVEEARVVIWPEHLGSTAFEHGIDQAQPAAGHQEPTGQQLVMPQ
jgi:hypothetical protein